MACEFCECVDFLLDGLDLHIRLGLCEVHWHQVDVDPGRCRLCAIRRRSLLQQQVRIKLVRAVRSSMLWPWGWHLLDG